MSNIAIDLFINVTLTFQERVELEDLLDESQNDLEESRGYINQLRQQHREEKRERALLVFPWLQEIMNNTTLK